MTRMRSDRGSATLEAVIVLPGFLLVIGVLIFAGRMALAQQAVDAASMDGARAASIARTQGAAQADARTSALSGLANQDLRCSSFSVNVNTAGFSVPVGQPAQVAVTVTCTVSLSDLAVPGLPGSRIVTGQATSPLDTYRER